MKRLDPWLKTLIISIFLVPPVLFFAGGFTDYLFAYFKKDRLESVLYHGTINTLFGTRFIYTYIDNREIFTTYLIQRHIELCEWQVKSLGWDNK